MASGWVHCGASYRSYFNCNILGCDFISPILSYRFQVLWTLGTSEIVEPEILPLLQTHPGIVFQQDNPCPHFNHIAHSFLGDQQVPLLPHTPRLPDFPPLNMYGIWLLEHWPICHHPQLQLMNCGCVLNLHGMTFHRQPSKTFITQCHTMYKL